MAKDYKYKFSFVIPVYNVESYLAETIDSILGQTMDFESSCEIIFVNDGSIDNSEAVCLGYKERFPDNITYIKQKNSGPGAARNRGAEVARGKYINPLDSDDKLSPKTLEEVYNFFELHYNDIDLVGIKWEFFEARRGPHPLNYKFTADRIIDLNTEFESFQGSAAPAFFKAEVFKRHKFDPAVGRYSEDARFMAEVLLENPKFGVVTKPTYFYRKRESLTSSQDINMTDRFWYLETPKRVWYDLFEYARGLHDGEVPKFIQYMAMYDLGWRFRQQTQTALDDVEQPKYKELLYGLLQDISDEVIVKQRNLDTDQKLFVLSKKHREPVFEHATRKGDKYFYRGIEIYDYKSANPAFHIEILEKQADGLHIEGYFGGYLTGESKLQFRLGGQRLDGEVVRAPKRKVTFLDEIIADRSRFQVTIPIESADLEVYVSTEKRRLPISTYRFSHISQNSRWAYVAVDNWLVSKHSDHLRIRQRTTLRHVGYELHYTALLAKRLKLRIFLQGFANWKRSFTEGRGRAPEDLKWLLVPLKSAGRNVQIVFYRTAYYVSKPFMRRPIWLLSDRIMAADDSGEILFEYLQKQGDLKAHTYFVISKKSGEYERLHRYGRVLNNGSFKHKLLFLHADRVISSEATDNVINAFGGRGDDLVDLYHAEFVFLQHGIIRDDISRWLNKYNKNIKLFVTSVKPERESILKGNYGYTEDVVQLTGLPRYDKLQNEPAGKLILMPTWRESLAGRVDFKTGHKQYNPNFKKSEYYHFFQGLMDDQQLHKTMKEHRMQGEFYLHPSFQLQIKDFKGNKYFKIMQMPFDYPRAKSEGSLLITDYSSVAFDFAYLKKPVVYTPFDKDSFYKVHTSQEGYFEYEVDGFGPVAYDFETSIGWVVRTIENGCVMEAKYLRRVDDFFAYSDRNNSERVYRAILGMSG
jgi:glycosyltransferase involved in cell wall biosynthesis